MHPLQHNTHTLLHLVLCVSRKACDCLMWQQAQLQSHSVQNVCVCDLRRDSSLGLTFTLWENTVEYLVHGQNKNRMLTHISLWNSTEKTALFVLKQPCMSGSSVCLCLMPPVYVYVRLCQWVFTTIVSVIVLSLWSLRRFAYWENDR